MSFDASRRTWLSPLVRTVTEVDRLPAPVLPGTPEFEPWLAAELAERGFALGHAHDHLPRYGLEAVGYAEFARRNTLVHVFELGDALIRAAVPGLPRVHRAHLLLDTLAWLTEDEALVSASVALDPLDEGSKALTEVAGHIAERLHGRSLRDGSPLLGHPFHQLLLYLDAGLFLRLLAATLLASRGPDGQPDSGRMQGILGQAHGEIYTALSACVALAAADGVVDKDERRLLVALFAAAGLSTTERAMLEAELASPAAPEEIARATQDPVFQAYLLRLLYLTAYINGNLDEAERAFVAELGAAFGCDEERLACYEVEGLVAYEAHAGLLGDLRWRKAVNRAQSRLVGRVESMLTANLQRIRDEVRETGELGQLLFESTIRPLSDAEKLRVRTQLADVAKAVPALAIFAAPGGALLLPLLAKRLPIDLRPSNFRDDENI
jgi:tellurite resistance protein